MHPRRFVRRLGTEVFHWALRVAVLFLRGVNRVTPKVPNRAVFFSAPDFSDNARAFYQFVVRLGLPLECIWLTKTELRRELQGRGVSAFSLGSLRGLLAILTARYVFATHAFLGTSVVCSRQSLVLLWHGTPLKTMGFADPHESQSSLDTLSTLADRVDVLISSSIIASEGLEACFRISPSKIRVTGQPRNDGLAAPGGRERLLKVIAANPERFKKVVLYMPTVREGYGHRREGKLPLLDLSPSDISRLDEVAKSHQAILILRLHPLDEKTLGSQVGGVCEGERVGVLTQGKLHTAGLDLYDVLSGADVLITDYSSVALDYLLVDRPIVYWTPDLEEYRQSRGFLLEPIQEWMPGPQAKTFLEMADHLDAALSGKDDFAEERARVRRLMNQQEDFQNCRRVWELLDMGREGRG